MDCEYFKKILGPVVATGVWAAVKELDREEATGRRQQTGELVLRERACRKTVDLAAKHWAKTREWAIIDKEVAGYLLMRFTAALSFLNEVEPLKPTFGAREQAVLRWLLVENWREFGHGRWVIRTFGEAAVVRRMAGGGRDF